MQIGIAIVEHQQRYLVGVRGPNIAMAGYDEFPGGKCLVNESPSACAIRECLEETGLRVRIDRLLDQQEIETSCGLLKLHFFLCHPVEVTQVQEQQAEFRWVSAVQLQGLRFPEANLDVVRMLTSDWNPTQSIPSKSLPSPESRGQESRGQESPGD